MLNFQLGNGLRVVGEKIPGARSVSVGLWVKVGSRSECKAENGISHFMEHMLFKGTEKRTAAQIACEMDAIGGNLNAFTTREFTCYYAKCVDEDVETVFDILSDMFLHSRLAPEETVLEKGVILEEISMYEDSPEDVAQELLANTVWPDNPLGRGIAGTASTVKAISAEDLKAFHQKYYTAKNTVLAIAGSFDEAHISALCETYFGEMPEGVTCSPFADALFSAGRASKEKDIEQTHIAIAYPGLPAGDDARYTMAAFAGAFGGGMSSRLFQKIREEKGLAYSIYAAPESFLGAGILNIYAGVSPENAGLVSALIRQEMQEILEKGVSEDEIRRSVSQMRAGYIMGRESISGRMQNLGRNILLFDKIQTEAEVLSGFERVTKKGTEELVHRLFSGDYAEVFVCPKG